MTANTHTLNMHLWLDRSGSIDPAVAARTAMFVIEEAETRHLETGVATRIKVSTFTHVLGNTTVLLTTTGQPLTDDRRAEVLKKLTSFDRNFSGGTEFTLIYDVAQQPAESTVDHVVVTDLEWAPRRDQVHPDNVRYVLLPMPYAHEHPAEDFLARFEQTPDQASIRIDVHH